MSETTSPAPEPEDKFTVATAAGRTIKFREMDPGDMLDLTEMAGEASTNRGYLQYAMIMFSITDIDGVPVPTPRNRNEMRALGKRIGNDGLVALTQRMFGTEAVARIAEDAETVKN